jgi:hypothetical protein
MREKHFFMIQALYRRLLQETRRFPAPHVRTKLQRNIRDAFTLHARERDPHTIKQFMDDGYAVIEFLQAFHTVDSPTIHTLFASSERNTGRREKRIKTTEAWLQDNSMDPNAVKEREHSTHPDQQDAVP